ncbi:serine hydrolase domain-containing protein [uncultured Brevundimonas sp.]|uniref:serine hydrolase domain-containing protein n=1 Tax=uncultured Brevundimonas sp. TaxID=213418 RepID=UPI00260123C1|nr:serine hydrolase domain-containing protein [uncultured Brevundimonas sp.]
MSIKTIEPAAAGMKAAALREIDAMLLSDIAGGRNFGASLLVARRGAVVRQSVLGQSAPGRLTAAGDRYILMSMSKAYTAVLVLRAIDAGLFDLDTRVSEIAPAFGAGGKQDATIRQLLCHTAGLPTTPLAPPLTFGDIGQLARHFEAICALEAVYEPGTRCAYTSGTGYDALGQLLVLTDPAGRSFRQMAHDEIFAPLGMSRSSFGLSPSDANRVPVSFTPSATTPASPIMAEAFNVRMDETAEYPCAGAFSDLADVFIFTEAVAGRGPTGYDLMSPALFDLARRNATGEMILENLPPKGAPAFPLDAAGQAPYPAHFTLLGGYVRGEGNIFSPAGRHASPETLAAVGGGTTGWMHDPVRDLTVIFLSAGLVEGVAHPQRLQKIHDMAIAAIED